jgi:hypothetical protein
MWVHERPQKGISQITLKKQSYKHRLDFPSPKIQNQKLFEHQHGTTSGKLHTMKWKVLKILYTITFTLGVEGVYEKQMNFIFRLGSHPQDITACLCKCFKIQQSLKSRTLWSPSQTPSTVQTALPPMMSDHMAQKANCKSKSPAADTLGAPRAQGWTTGATVNADFRLGSVG